MNRNDRNAEFEGVVNAHWADVLRLGILMFADETEAEDVAQETFFKAYTAWHIPRPTRVKNR
jgi:DNA-directed RNA polymerase specialized sigma24 family protein